jgi:hypothetical protein
MPAVSTIMKWLQRVPSFAEQYARAREIQADALVEETLEIVDDGTNDWMEKRDKDGNCVGWQVNGEAVQRSKLRADQRRWWAGKLRPKVYGEKLNVEHSGHVDIGEMSREEILAELQLLVNRGAPVPEQLLLAGPEEAPDTDVSDLV